MQLCQLQYLPENAPDKISDVVKVLMVANAYDEYTAMQLDIDPHTEVEAIRMLQSRPDLYDPAMVTTSVCSTTPNPALWDMSADKIATFKECLYT